MKITRAQLEELIDDDTFMERGESYFESGAVKLVSIKEKSVEAESLGSRLYQINLYFDKENGYLDGDCSCPAFEDYGPCKHIAATGLALIAQNNDGYNPSEEFEDRRSELTRIRDLLMKKDKKELVDMILKFADDDPEIYYMLDEDEDY